MKSKHVPVFFAAAAALLLVAASARADLIVYHASLSGAAEEPAVETEGTGFATVIIDTTANTMRVKVNFSGLTGVTTVSHIHGPTTVPGAGNAGVMTTTPTFTAFPAGVSSGSYDHTYDLDAASTYNPAFVTANGDLAGAKSAFLAVLADGKAYLNVHSNFSPRGEIRGFLTVPDGGTTLALLSFGLAALGGLRSWRGRLN